MSALRLVRRWRRSSPTATASARHCSRPKDENARQFVWEADAELEQATAQVQAARDHHQQLVRKAAISGSRIPSDQGLRDARIAEADAADRLQAAKDALASLQNLGPLKGALELAEMSVEKAAKDVVKDEVQHWQQQMHELHQHYLSRMSAYSWLTNSGMVDDTLPKHVGTQTMLYEVESDRNPSRIAWQHAFKALCLDADAELPE
jgi:hypothetical protein